MSLKSRLAKCSLTSCATLAATVLWAALPAHAVTGYVRVNQLGYEKGTAMRAYLMTTSAVSAVHFAVVNASGQTVASGSAGAKLGAFGAYSVYPIDFMLSTAGTYTIKVSGPVTAASPAFRAEAPASLYSTPLANSLAFYQTERDGPNFIPSPLRTAAGHLNDATALVYTTPSINANDLILGSLSPTGASIDARGGWWDAGDYLKFVQTHSYVEALMLIGIRDFPNQMGSLSASSNFTDEAKFGITWLQQMWNDSTRTLYYQVGIGTDFKSFNYLSDHDVWRLPQADDTLGGSNTQYQYIRNRPVFLAGPPGSKISPNLAGRMAASFAECFQVYSATDPTLANQCLLSAEHIFDLANTAPTGNLLTVAPFDFYPETEWRDDLQLGATELYFALQRGNLPPGLPHTDPMFYLTAAANWAHAYITGPNDQTDTLNLYDVSGLAHFELHRAITLAGNPCRARGYENCFAKRHRQSDRFLYSRSQRSVWLRFALERLRYGFARSGPFRDGTGILLPDEHQCLRHGSRRWLANISGANPWGVTFTIGDGSTFPDCPQHQVANIVGSLNGAAPVLVGGVVEGPTSASTTGSLTGMQACPVGGGDSYKKFNGNSAVYKDNVQSYSTDEPAIDLASTSFLMYAWRIAGAPSRTP